MPARPLALAALLLCTAVLAACDIAGDDGTTGRWVGTAEFTADTILAAHNVRIIADYETEFTFRLTDDDGLVTGQLTARTSGYRVVREAGQPSDTLWFDASAPVVHEVFGTFLDPTLEVDVPDGPYEDDLWTFEVSGRSAQTDRFLVHIHEIAPTNSSSFEHSITSEEIFEMRRVGDLDEGTEGEE